MDTITILLLILVIFLLAAVFAIIIYLLRNNKRNDHLRDDLLIITNQINNVKDSTTDRLLQIEEHLTNNIIKTSEITNNTFNQINERLIKIDDNQKALDDLSTNIISLKDVMVDKKTRGTYGEVELYSILEQAFGSDKHFYDKQVTLPNGSRVDALVHGFGSLEDICIDSKFPLENYRRMYDKDLSQLEKDKAKNSFKVDVSKHLNDISSKYIIPGTTAPMAYMFVPSEAIFSEIYGNFPELIDKAYELKVYIVSPTTLMAYITAIKSIYLGIKKNEKAKEIERLLLDLSVEFTRLKDRSETLQRDFERIIPDFEKMFVTENKIIKRFAAIEKGDIEND